MTVSDAVLVARLRERNADRTAATDGGIHPRKALPRVTEAKLRSTETILGFPLPDLVRTLYLQVGNGGFGPLYGIVGTKGGAKLDGCTLESCYQRMLELANDSPAWRWPPQLLPLANYGCGMWSCVDCTYRRLPMILWDPNNLDEDLDSGDAQENWSNAFWDQCLTFKQWLLCWLDNAGEPEPKRPSATWTKKRLGMTRSD